MGLGRQKRLTELLLLIQGFGNLSGQDTVLTLDLSVFEEDNDGDGLSNGFESMIGTDPDLDDTDGDLLSDYQELYLTWTDPTLYDTDGNGISDADEDLDGDGLCNIYELGLGTDTAHPDSDRDDLSDYDEIYVHSTDPLNQDTDGPVQAVAKHKYHPEKEREHERMETGCKSLGHRLPSTFS